MLMICFQPPYIPRPIGSLQTVIERKRKPCFANSTNIIILPKAAYISTRVRTQTFSILRHFTSHGASVPSLWNVSVECEIDQDLECTLYYFRGGSNLQFCCYNI
jgi:hypothetical protein